jgi:hypothetical protein
MDARTVAYRHALGRAGIGAALTLAPGALARAWVGRKGATTGARVIATALGARDLALGVGIARAVRSGSDAGTWLRAAVFADAVDLIATLRGRDDLPALGVVGVGGMAAGSAALGLWLQRELGER